MDTILRYGRAMQTVSAAPMPIPGHIDPVPVPRGVQPRPDGRVDLIGLTKDQFKQQMDLIQEVKKGNTSALEGTG